MKAVTKSGYEKLFWCISYEEWFEKKKIFSPTLFHFALEYAKRSVQAEQEWLKWNST
jgi:hypothetical protein